MNDLQIFSNPEFGSIRTRNEDGKVLFAATDVAKALGYSNPRDAIARHCPHVVKRDIGVQTGTKADGTPAMQNVELSFIPEGDVYRLITHSNLPDAEKFEHWLFDDMLPTLRKTGSYSIIQADPSLPPELALANQTLAAVNKIYQMQLSQGERLDKLEATRNIDYAQGRAIVKAKNINIVEQLGGKGSQAYKIMSKKVFSEFWNDYYDAFGVQAYADTPAVRYEEALKYAKTWQPCTNTKIEVEQANNQTSMFS